MGDDEDAAEALRKVLGIRSVIARIESLEEEVRRWTTAAGQDLAGLRVRIGAEENARERLERRIDASFAKLRHDQANEEQAKLLADHLGAAGDGLEGPCF